MKLRDILDIVRKDNDIILIRDFEIYKFDSNVKTILNDATLDLNVEVVDVGYDDTLQDPQLIITLEKPDIKSRYSCAKLNIHQTDK